MVHLPSGPLQRKQNKVKLCNLKITGLFLFPHLSRMTAHLQNSMFVKHSQKQGAAICFAVGFNDVVSENAITLTFCLKIRDYDDRAFLLIEKISAINCIIALCLNIPFHSSEINSSYLIFMQEKGAFHTDASPISIGCVPYSYRMYRQTHTVALPNTGFRVT